MFRNLIHYSQQVQSAMFYAMEIVVDQQLFQYLEEQRHTLKTGLVLIIVYYKRKLYFSLNDTNGCLFFDSTNN